MYKVLLEDSSKVKFGGGQKISAELINSNTTDEWIVFDSDAEDSFIKSIKSSEKAKIVRYPSTVSFSSFRSSSESSFVRGVFEFILSLKALTVIIPNISSLDDDVVIYATTKKMLLLGLIAKMLANNVVCLIFHYHSIIDRGIYKIIFEWLCNRFVDHSIFPSEFAAKSSMISQTKKKVILNFVDDKLFVHKNRKWETDITVTFVGSHLTWKGIHLFDEIACLLEKNKRFRFVSYGGQPDARLKLKCVEYMGVDDIEKIMNKVDVVVIPSLAAESFCLVAAEALISGKSIVCSNEGALPEVVHPNRYSRIVVKPPYTAERYVDALLKVKEKNRKEKPEYWQKYRKSKFLRDFYDVVDKIHKPN